MDKLISPEMREVLRRSHTDWCYFAETVLNVNLDTEQKKILRVIQHEPMVSVRSGNARGKDYLAAVASNCWLHLFRPSRVVSTAPTGRQVENIMMTEIRKVRSGAKVQLGGRVLQGFIKFDDDSDRDLIAFKASDTADEAWTGFHSANIMVIVSEASGISDRTFENIEKILPGNSRLVLVFNPVRSSGEAFRSISDPRYKSFRLNCLDAPNVIAKKIIIPGQCDWDWVNKLVHKPGLTQKIDADDIRPDLNDFEWEGQWYRPSDLFNVMVIGEPPTEDENQLIPYSWVKLANDRWLEIEGKKKEGTKLSLGADIAGMGVDRTALLFRYGNVVTHTKHYSKTKLMATVGEIKNILVANPGGTALIDTIGEGAGVFGRAEELKMPVVAANVAKSAKGKTDSTGLRHFLNMRAWCYWQIRDALDPQFDSFRDPLALPPDNDLIQELCEHHWENRSNGDIVIEPKDDIKSRIGRSPDDSDALALSYYPERKKKVYKPIDLDALGLM